MNILVVANIPPYAKGGAENQAKMLAEEFVSLGHAVTVVGNKIPNDTSDENFIFKTAHLSTLNFTRLGRACTFFLSLAYFVLRNRKKIDVIYCRFLGEAALSIGLLKKTFGLDIPLVPCTACAGKTGDAHLLSSLPFTASLVRLVNQQCNAINNISPKIGEELSAIGVDSRLFSFFPNGIHIGKVTKKKNVSSPRKLVFLGRLAPQKAIPVLLDAVGLILKSGKPLELHLIGDGPDRFELESMVENRALANNVFFHGYVDNQDLPQVLLGYDVFVLPSLYEGFATATIEAMLAGLPAVVTRSGGPDYFVDDSVGRVCSINDARALADSLLEILCLDDGDLLAMGERAQRRVINRFDIKVLAQRYIELFEELIRH